MVEQIIANQGISFNDLENQIHRQLCEVGCGLLEEILETIDNKIMAQRPVSKYSNLGFRATHIETVMGRVDFKRRVYSFLDEEGQKRRVFLLDEKINLFGVGKMSSALIEVIAKQISVDAFRPAANAISTMTGIQISHGCVWNMAQKIGEKIKEVEDQSIALYKAEQITGQKEVDVLFEEADGVYLKLQGKDRKRHGKAKELKVAVTYEGWKEKGKNRFILENKKFCSSFESSKAFNFLKESMIASQYNKDEIKARFQNGDGAPWIHEQLDGSIVSQLDPFHIKKALIRNIRNKENRKTVDMLLNSKKISLALEVIETLKNNAENEKEEKRLKDLYTYFNNNRDILVPYRERGIILPKLPEGLIYRGMGTMEHHICDVIAQRMKGRKGSWSISGGSNMARILCAKKSKQLFEIIRAKLIPIIPSQYERIVTDILSAGKVPQKIGKGSDGNIRHGGMPFKGVAVTNGRKAIQQLLEINYSFIY